VVDRNLVAFSTGPERAQAKKKLQRLV